MLARIKKSLPHLLYDYFTIVIAKEGYNMTFRVSKALLIFLAMVFSVTTVMGTYSRIIVPIQEEQHLKLQEDVYRHIKLLRELGDIVAQNKALSGELAVSGTDILNIYDKVEDADDPYNSRMFSHMSAKEFFTRINTMFTKSERMEVFTSIPYGMPVTGLYGSGYEYRFFNGRWEHHPGIDFNNVPGTPIYSTANGKVINAGWGGMYYAGYGISVVIDTGAYYVLYGHLSSVNVQYGQKVYRGMMVGRMGSTGESTGYHLHYEIRRDLFSPVNPEEFSLGCTRGTICRNSFDK